MKNWLIVHSLESFTENPRMIGFSAKTKPDGSLVLDNERAIPSFKRINEIKPKDKIVYYGKGDCVIKGVYEIVRPHYAKETKWPGSPFQYEIKPIVELDEPYDFKLLVSSLDLFKNLPNKKNWGMSLQGKYNSIKLLTDYDLKLIEESITQKGKITQKQGDLARITSEKIMSDKVKTAVLSGTMKLPDENKLKCDIAIREMGFRNCQFDVIGYNKDENTVYIFECKLGTNITTIGQAFGQLLGYKAVLKERGYEFLSRFFDKYYEEVSTNKGRPKIKWTDWIRISSRKKINFRFFVVFKERTKDIVKEIISIKKDIKPEIGVLSITKDGVCTPHMTWKKETDTILINSEKIEISFIKKFKIDEFFDELQYKMKNNFFPVYPKFKTNKYPKNGIIQFKLSPNTHYEMIVKKKEVEIGLHIEASKNVTERIFSLLSSKEKDIKRKLGSRVVFDGKWGKNWAKVYEMTPRKSLNEELLEDAYERIKNYIEVIQPILD